MQKTGGPIQETCSRNPLEDGKKKPQEGSWVGAQAGARTQRTLWDMSLRRHKDRILECVAFRGEEFGDELVKSSRK